MRIVVTRAGVEREIDVCRSEDASVADLCGAVFPEREAIDEVYVGDRKVAADTPVGDAGIGAGAVLSLDPPAAQAAAAVHLHVLSGPGAGSSLGLLPGRHVIGSGPGATVVYRAAGVRPRTATIHVGERGEVAVGPPDAGPSRVIGPTTLLDVGGPLLAVVRRQESTSRLRAMPGRRGTVAFNRPPRRVPKQSQSSVVYPEALEPPRSTGRLSVIALVVPVLFGVTLAVLIHPRMALFALLGPVMMVGNWLEDRRRKRKHRRESAAQDDHDAAVISEALDRAAAAEVLRRHRSCPSLAELARWPGDSSRLWERRPGHDDFMALLAGYGRLPWTPPTSGNPAAASEYIRAIVARRNRLPRGPATLDLTPGNVAGVAGGRADALCLVRGLLCQAAVLHGPADLKIAIVTDEPADWQWATWLPHTLADSAAGRRLLATTPEERSRLVSLLTPAASERSGPGWGLTAPGASAPGPQTLIVVDTRHLAEGEGAGLRSLLGGGAGPVAGIVLAPEVDALPSMCNRVLEVSGHRAAMVDPHGSAVQLAVAGADPAVARGIARDLARFTDPERHEEGAELPSAVDLVELIGGTLPSPAEVARWWASAGDDPPLAAPIGVTEAGPLMVDVVRDGPHGLLAGTTGAGKSELLRTLVVSLALAVDPDHLTFVLIDYKGGSAFDACAALPHTVGMVTDLDDQLAARALQCLEAELRYREHTLREAGAEDIGAHLKAGSSEPLPRMVIVIDEFAALAKELPDFMDALVDIAARGRSLGVHLLLATQRPAGVIRDNVRANTNLRIALRVQDRADSQDVIGDARASAIGRSQPGRGFARFGPSEIVPFQAALVTGISGAAGPRSRVQVRDVVFGMEAPELPAPSVAASGPTDLERLVAAVGAAAHLAGCRPPRRPWPDPLPEMIDRASLDDSEPPTASAVPVGIVDEPDFQRHRTMWWDPRQGSLAMYGLTGAGTTTALVTIATSLADRYRPDLMHVYVMDFDAGALTPLAELPHVGAVITAAERERQVRLVRRLEGELERRKASASSGEAWPTVALLVDNFAGFVAAFDSAPDAPIRDALYRVLMEGPGLGIVAVVTGTRQNAIPLAVGGTIASKLVFRMADPLAAATFGLRHIPPDLPPGRAIHVTSRRTVQIAAPHPAGIEAAVADLVAPHGPERVPGCAPPIDVLPSIVTAAEVGGVVRIGDREWWIPVGLGDTDLAPVGLPLGPGDHVLIAGEARSGRSSLLCGIGEVVARHDPTVSITVVAPRPSPLCGFAGATPATTPEEIAEATAISDSAGSHLVLIDDVDAIEATPALRSLVASQRPDLHVIAAGRRDLKTQYNHWARELCRSRVGVWLKPGPGLDGDLWSTPMPRHVPSGLPAGRGFVVAHGAVELVQTMSP